MATVFHFPYRTVAEVRLRALLRNLHTLRGLSQKEVIPVIKANAYGHGLVPVAKALVHRGSCSMLAVATLEEAISIRETIPRGVSLLVLSGFFPHQVEAYVKYHLTPMIHSLPHLKSLLGRKTLPELHLKVDTGMHRLGIPLKHMEEAAKTLERLPAKLSGLATHFADSEDLESAFIDQQIAAFEGVHEKLLQRRLLNTDARIHVSNSGGILRGKGNFATAVRPGISLFGISPNDRISHSKDLLPVLEWKTRVLCLKEVARGESVGYGRTYVATRKEKIAILPVGYADGYPRSLSGKSFVILNGKRSLVRGRVSMDLLAIDVTNQTNVKEGQVVTLLGGHGRMVLGASTLGRLAGSFAYEILCGISDRVPRIYLD
jgi:alanine racemase